MARRVGIFVDVRDVYECIVRRYGKNRKLNYKKYLNWAHDVGIVQLANAYGVQVYNEADIFIDRLKRFGFQCKFYATENTRSFSWDSGMTADILSVVDRLDMVILGTSSKNFQPLIRHLRERGLSVIVVACGISQYLKEVCTRFVEIPESMLEAYDPSLDNINNNVDNSIGDANSVKTKEKIDGTNSTTGTNMSCSLPSDGNEQTSGDSPKASPEVG